MVTPKPLLQDEGIFLTISKLISSGLLPYVDIFDHKTPGIYYMLSLGGTYFLAKLLIYLCNTMIVILVANISEKIKKGSFGPAIFLMFCGLVIFEGGHIFTEQPMTLFLLLASIFLHRKSSKNIFAAGFFLGLAALFKQTAIINVVVSIVWLALFSYTI